MKKTTEKNGTSRRGFLKAAAIGTGALAATLWLPKRARAAGTGSIKRVLIINAPGGVRWTSHFDGQSDVNHNPWGILNDPASAKWTSPAVSGAVSGVAAPGWGVARLLAQKPQWMNTKGWSAIYSYLSSDSAGDYNLTRVPVSSPWSAAGLPNKVPNVLDLASEIAVLRVTADPGGVFNSDHASASHTLVTALRSGQVGMVTAFQHALRAQLGGAFDTSYAMPAVSVGNAGWALGVDMFAKARPIYLSNASSLPGTDPGNSVSQWGHLLEGDWDQGYLASRQQYVGQSIADYVNDKANGDAHVKQLIQPQLHLSANGTTGYGTLTDGATPVTNAMLWEVFGIGSANTVAGDPYLDVYASDQNTATPSWTSSGNDYGLQAGLAVRLLQTGAPIVSLSVGVTYDSHGGEVISTQALRTQGANGVAMARTLCGLEFALKRIADPTSAGKSLWDSTVIFVCSEFGRGVSPSSADGFNVPNGANLGGSDHGPWSAWPVLGGPVIGGGKLLTDPNADTKANPQGFYQQNRLYATLLAGLGIDAANSAYLDLAKFPPITGALIQGV